MGRFFLHQFGNSGRARQCRAPTIYYWFSQRFRQGKKSQKGITHFREKCLRDLIVRLNLSQQAIHRAEYFPVWLQRAFHHCPLGIVPCIRAAAILATFSMFGHITLRNRKLHVCIIRSISSGSDIPCLRQKFAFPKIDQLTQLQFTRTWHSSVPQPLQKFSGPPFLSDSRLRQTAHSATYRSGWEERAINHSPIAPTLFAKWPVRHDDSRFATSLQAIHFLRESLCAFRM
jgi:hypothetical protein